MGSTRLPGKVLMPIINGKSTLEVMLARVMTADMLDEVIVATSTEPLDDEIESAVAALGVTVFRGDHCDVLSRYYECAKEAGAEIIVRLTADCPLYDGGLLDDMLNRFEELRKTENVDYMSNTLVRSFPRGLDTEIFTFDALEHAYQCASKPHEREHVTPFIYNNADIFSMQSYVSSRDDSDLRITLDTPADYMLISSIYEIMSPDTLFGRESVLELLRKREDLVALNSNVEQKKMEES